MLILSLVITRSIRVASGRPGGSRWISYLDDIRVYEDGIEYPPMFVTLRLRKRETHLHMQMYTNRNVETKQCIKTLE